jgi:hypothetical protein
MTRASRTTLAVASALSCLALFATAPFAQEQFFGRGRNQRQLPSDATVQGNTPYDGRWVFVRVRYDGGGFGSRRREPTWAHDYPTGEVHFTKILNEITLLRPRTDGSNILSLDDPELFNYPIAYMCEPGFWSVSDTEADAFRKYLLKGGFAIFDDFRGGDWENLQEQMHHVLPDHRWVELDGTTPVFHSFFEIDNPSDLAPPYGGLPPSYWGLFENNDPKKRLMAIANVNNDISEYWEWSDTGYAPVDLSNEAYKFGVNYVIYGLTH